jgi:hypothetical protein
MEEQQANARVKTNNKVDYDRIFEERQAKLAGVKLPEKTEEETKGMSKATKGMIMEKA